MAVVGLNYQFIYNDVGYNGSLSDGGVFWNRSLFEVLENGMLPNNGVIIGDNAFPLKTISRSKPGLWWKNMQLQTVKS
jgi:hypothetical protein